MKKSQKIAYILCGRPTREGAESLFDLLLGLYAEQEARKLSSISNLKQWGLFFRLGPRDKDRQVPPEFQNSLGEYSLYLLNGVGRALFLFQADQREQALRAVLMSYCCEQLSIPFSFHSYGSDPLG